MGFDRYGRDSRAASSGGMRCRSRIRGLTRRQLASDLGVGHSTRGELGSDVFRGFPGARAGRRVSSGERTTAQSDPHSPVADVSARTQINRCLTRLTCIMLRVKPSRQRPHPNAQILSDRPSRPTAGQRQPRRFIPRPRRRSVPVSHRTPLGFSVGARHIFRARPSRRGRRTRPIAAGRCQGISRAHVRCFRSLSVARSSGSHLLWQARRQRRCVRHLP